MRINVITTMSVAVQLMNTNDLLRKSEILSRKKVRPHRQYLVQSTHLHKANRAVSDDGYTKIDDYNGDGSGGSRRDFVFLSCSTFMRILVTDRVAVA